MDKDGSFEHGDDVAYSAVAVVSKTDKVGASHLVGTVASATSLSVATGEGCAVEGLAKAITVADARAAGVLASTRPVGNGGGQGRHDRRCGESGALRPIPCRRMDD